MCIFSVSLKTCKMFVDTIQVSAMRFIFYFFIFLHVCLFCFNHVQSTEVSWPVMLQKWILERGDGGEIDAITSQPSQECGFCLYSIFPRGFTPLLAVREDFWG